MSLELHFAVLLNEGNSTSISRKECFYWHISLNDLSDESWFKQEDRQSNLPRIMRFFYRPQTKFGARQCFYLRLSFCPLGEGVSVWGVSLTEIPLDRDSPPDRDPPDRDSPLDRDPPWTETLPGQRPSLDRDPPWTETLPGQRPSLDRDLPCTVKSGRDASYWMHSCCMIICRKWNKRIYLKVHNYILQLWMNSVALLKLNFISMPFNCRRQLHSTSENRWWTSKTGHIGHCWTGNTQMYNLGVMQHNSFGAEFTSTWSWFPIYLL